MSEAKALALGYLAVASTGRDMRPLADNPAVALLVDAKLVDGASGRITDLGRLAARHFRAQAELFFAVYVNGRLGETSAEPTATEPLAAEPAPVGRGPVTQPNAIDIAKPHEVNDAT